MLLNNVISSHDPRLPHCRCLPNESCWPNLKIWEEFNKTIGGNLLRLRPVGSSCHGIEYDQNRCATVRASTHNGLWRISEPAAYQWTNWESLQGDLEWGSCPIEGSREIVCSQGRIPLYAVMAQSAQQVQSAVRFAKSYNIRITIRNTGHDSIGRSSGPDSIQINLSGLKTIRFMDDFIPRGGHQSDSQGQAVTVGAGVLGMELLQAGQRQGLNVMTAESRSVGAVGGFLQGGGTSLLGPVYGMASDNALEFTVVTAEGDLVVANRFHNTDLFWALRGGGGGSFGITLDVTIRTFSDVPAVRAQFTMTLSRQNRTSLNADQSLWDITAEIANLLPILKRLDDTTGAVIVLVILVDSVALTAEVVFTDFSDVSAAQLHFTRLLEETNKRGLPYMFNLTLYPQLSTYLNEPSRDIDMRGVGQVEGSVLVSEQLFFKSNGTSEIINLLSRLQFESGDSVEILMSTGGQVKANKGIIDSALLPAWRDSALLITIRRFLPSNSTTKRMRNSQLPYLRSMESPYMGSYLNVADPDEPDFQRAFWGDNYKRLYQIKQKWDPNGLFIVRMGVGSENWDDEGICRCEKPRASVGH
ncbi:hypothetical protein BJX63DRAFT_419875 [Aspergillus granulosus]|uniref:FAD-binding PCMH-type domain-containing protein n=1 Tax=Aspergillus granulosus TaxID=176169 RepID=A0ABR4HMI1_9EURO